VLIACALITWGNLAIADSASLNASSDASFAASGIKPGASSAGQLASIGPVTPIVVEADGFEVRMQEERAIWQGNVVATQGNYTFRTGRLTVYMEQVSSSRERKSNNASSTAATFAGYELSANKLTYDLDQGQIVGRGNSELRHGAEYIRADQIVYDVTAQTATAHPDAEGRVHVKFYGNPAKPVFPSATPALAAQ